MPLSSFDKPNLMLRTISALVLVPIALAAVYFGGYVYAILIVSTAAIGIWEWMQMTAPKEDKHFKLLPVAFVAIALVFAEVFYFSLGLAGVVFAVCLMYLAALKRGKKNIAVICIGIPYVALGSLALLYIRGLDYVGALATFYLMITVWATDIGAFMVGRIVGGPKLWPSVSPNKTWAGLVGGAVVAAIAGGAFVAAISPQYAIKSVVVALFLAIVAQGGDLFESHIKRLSGVKDSGNIIPGHGGVLDRVDGLLFASAFFALLMAIW